MDADLLEYFGPREEPLFLGGREVVVRTLPDDADRAGFKDCAADEYLWKFVVRCTFYKADGKPAFSDDDIAVLKSAPRIRTIRLVQAVENVNGFNVVGEVKNSVAAPSAG